MGPEHEDRDRTGEVATYALADVAVRGIVPLGGVEPWGMLEVGSTHCSHAWDEDHREEEVSLTGPNLGFGFGAT